jgi:hypothetical protein
MRLSVEAVATSKRAPFAFNTLASPTNGKKLAPEAEKASTGDGYSCCRRPQSLIGALD